MGLDVGQSSFSLCVCVLYGGGERRGAEQGHRMAEFSVAASFPAGGGGDFRRLSLVSCMGSFLLGGEPRSWQRHEHVTHEVLTNRAGLGSLDMPNVALGLSVNIDPACPCRMTHGTTSLEPS